MCSYLFPWGLLARAIDGVQKEGEFQAFLVNHGGEREDGATFASDRFHQDPSDGLLRMFRNVKTYWEG